ncbi:MAG: CDP-glycerol glycerophosphotransferase family protein, partial [Propionibacteriaceae bacterium]
QVGPPLAADERSAYGQRVLRERYLGPQAEPVDGSVLMQVGEGEHAGDAAVAIYRELRARGDRTPVSWAVRDLSRETPPGVAAVVLGSSAWYQALARARTVVLSGQTSRYPRGRASQTVLQTFRGYPVELPPASTRLDAGWPRNDLVTGPEVTERRKSVRAELGLDDDDVVLLWAPAWRQSPGTGSWEPVDGPLALTEVVDQLDDDVVVLVAGGSVPTGTAGEGLPLRVVDVRWHPRIDDLILASDAAVIGSQALTPQYAASERPHLGLEASLTGEQLRELVDRASSAEPRGPSVAEGAAAAVVKVLWPHLP